DNALRAPRGRYHHHPRRRRNPESRKVPGAERRGAYSAVQNNGEASGTGNVAEARSHSLPHSPCTPCSPRGGGSTNAVNPRKGKPMSSYEKIVTLFDTAAHAEAAKSNLAHAGFSTDEMSIVSGRELPKSLDALR